MRLSPGLWAALALGLALRLSYAWYGYTRGAIPTSNDGYETIAINLVSGNGYSLDGRTPTALREPGYPLLIAAVYALTGVHAWLIPTLQVAMGVAAALVLLAAGRRLFSDAEAGIAFTAMLFYPASVYYGAYFFRETWLALLFVLFAWSSCYWSEPSRRGECAALAGGLLGCALGLTNTAALVAVAPAGAGLWFSVPLAARFKRAALYAAPVLLGCSVWTWRNWRTQGMFILGSTHAGDQLYRALIVPPKDLGMPRESEIEAKDEVLNASERMETMAEQNAFLLRASLKRIGEKPLTYAGYVCLRAVKLWRLWPYPRAYNHGYWMLVLASLLSDGWMVVLGFLGLWRFRSRWREAPGIPSSILGITAAFAAVHAVIRYRIPVMPMMILLATAEARRLLARAAKTR